MGDADGLHLRTWGSTAGHVASLATDNVASTLRWPCRMDVLHAYIQPSAAAPPPSTCSILPVLLGIRYRPWRVSALSIQVRQLSTLTIWFAWHFDIFPPKWKLRRRKVVAELDHTRQIRHETTTQTCPHCIFIRTWLCVFRCPYYFPPLLNCVVLPNKLHHHHHVRLLKQ